MEETSNFREDSVASYSDLQLTTLIDSVLDIMDLNKDGFITYDEYKYQPPHYRNEVNDNDIDENNLNDENTATANQKSSLHHANEF